MSRNHRGLGKRWERTRRAVLNRAGWRCEGCGLAGPLEAHHVKPLRLGGAVYGVDNLKALCGACHKAEHARPETPEQGRWRKLVEASKGFDNPQL